MVRKLLIIITTVMILFSTSFAATQVGPNLQIVNSNIDPNPVKPGNDLTLSLNIINSGDILSEDITVEVKSSDIFYYRGNDLSLDVFSLCGGCSYDANYYFQVKPTVKSGIYPIVFNIYHDNGQLTTQTINLKVDGVADLIVLDDNADNLKLFPGDEFSFEFKLENVGTSDAKNIKISQGSDKIIKVGSDLEYFDELKIGEKIDISTKFKIDENLNPGLYQIQVIVDFENDRGELFSKQYNLGVEVLNKAIINIQYLKLNEYQVNLFKDVEISGMIENVGFGKADNVYIEAETNLEGFKTSFVGALDKNEDSPIQFKFKANEVGVQDIKLNIYYVDDLGEHMFSQTVQVNVTKPTSRLYTILGIIAIVLVIVGVKVFSKKKKSQN